MDHVLVWLLIDTDFNKCFRVSFSIPKNPFTQPYVHWIFQSSFILLPLSQPSITLWNKFKFSLLPILSQFKERHVGQVMILIDPTKLQLDKAMGSVSANESAVWITNNYTIRGPDIDTAYYRWLLWLWLLPLLLITFSLTVFTFLPPLWRLLFIILRP